MANWVLPATGYVLALGAIGYFVWQWMHHHGVHFHLPMH